MIADLRSETECQEIDRLDAAQAEFARSLGDGHRILTGCAGSGKTLVVAARARFLKQVYPAWRIRVICFNAELVPHIQKLLGNTEIDLEPKIVVQNFHAYAREFIGKTFERLAGDDDGSIAERTAQAFIEIAGNPPPNGAYDALLIDEGQDLRPEWTNALVSLVNGKTNSVLFAASRQQNIYGVSSYKNMGISAGGRTKHLRKSYRCSAEIITLAEAFQPDPVRRPDAKVETKDSGSLFAASEQTSRRTPQFIACADFPALCKYVCAEIARSVRAGLCDYSDIAILYTNRYLQSLEPLANALSNQFGIQHVFRKWQSGSRLMPDDDSIKMITVHGSKGLEWRIVFLLGIDDLPRPKMDLVRERSLVYVALTRAKDEIHFVSLREKGFHKDLKELGLTLV